MFVLKSDTCTGYLIYLRRLTIESSISQVKLMAESGNGQLVKVTRHMKENAIYYVQHFYISILLSSTILDN